MLGPVLRSEKTAMVAMAILIGVALSFAYQFYGWLGVGAIGLVGLVISSRAELFEHYGDPHERSSSNVVTMYKEQLRNRDHEGHEQALKREHLDAARRRRHRVINAILASIMMLGGGMYVARLF